MKILSFIIITLALLLGLFFFFKPKPQLSETKQNPQQIPVPITKTFNLVINANKIASGPEVLKANHNDLVIIKVISDSADALHLHGYDHSVQLSPNVEKQLSFKANLTGRFEFELEHSKTHLGVLEVQP